MNSPWFAVALLGAAVLGWLLAVVAPDLAWLNALTDILRTAFLSALKMIIAPLILASIVAGGIVGIRYLEYGSVTLWLRTTLGRTA